MLTRRIERTQKKFKLLETGRQWAQKRPQVLDQVGKREKKKGELNKTSHYPLLYEKANKKKVLNELMLCWVSVLQEMMMKGLIESGKNLENKKEHHKTSHT